MRKYSLIVVVILIMGSFIMESNPGSPSPDRKRKIWDLNDDPESKRRKVVDELMVELFPDWTDEDIDDSLFTYFETSRECIEESANYVPFTSYVGLNDAFAKVIGKGKDVTRENVINIFSILPTYSNPERANLGIGRAVNAISIGLTTAQQLATEVLQRLNLLQAGPSNPVRIGLTLEEAINILFAAFLLSSLGQGKPPESIEPHQYDSHKAHQELYSTQWVNS